MAVDDLIAALGWLVTPALVTSIALALARYVDAGVRWERRLRGDVQLSGGLPSGDEKSRLEKSIDFQAKRLRQYREAFGPRRQVFKWAQILVVALVVALTIRYPPINTPQTKIPFGPADYMMMAMGGVVMIVAFTGLIRGRDWQGRTAAELLRNDRVRRFYRRERRWNRLNKARAELIESGSTISPRGSSLGFRTQVDELGPWMKTHELRQAAITRGTPARDIDYRCREAVRKAGQKLPSSD